MRIVEVSVSYYPRIGKSKISGTLAGTLGAASFIFSLIVSYYSRWLVGLPPAFRARALESVMESSNSSKVPSRNRNRVLLIIAKAARPGMVKTRLAQSLPLPAVTARYRCAAELQIAPARAPRTTAWLAEWSPAVTLLRPCLGDL